MSKISERKTQEEYVKEVTEKNSNIEVLGIYVDSKTPILHKCKIDGYVWMARPSNILNSKGCPKCAGNIKKTSEEYKKELEIINPGIECIEQYINEKSPIKHHCKVCGNIWKTSPASTLLGCGCPKCSAQRAGDKQKRTQQEYVEELREKNPNLDVLEEYINASTKIKHRCLKHGIVFETTPARALMGVGCELCHKEKIRSKNAKTKEKFNAELHQISPYIDLIGDYIGANSTARFFCNKHQVEWETSPASVLQGHGCLQCGNEKVANKLIKPRSQYIQELAKINSNIYLIGEYKGANTKALHECKICGNQWYANPANILSGTGCPVCAQKQRTQALTRTHEQYVEELSKINPNIEVLGQYVNSQTKILHRCIICGYEWNVVPSSLLNGSDCPKCSAKRCADARRRTQEEYISELKKIHPNINVLEDYVAANTPILHRCEIHNYEWKVTPGCLLSGHGCPKCSESKGEQQICSWLDDYKIEYVQQKRFADCRDKNPLPFDFYLPNENVCIEFDGEQHFRSIDYFGGEEELEYVQMHDNMKTKYCEENNIKLLRIPYYNDIDSSLQNFLFN